MSNYVVCALYRFVVLEDYESIQQPLLTFLSDNHIKGTLLLAREGINGTVSGTQTEIDKLLAWFEKDGRFAGISYKLSYVDELPFYRTRVKLKKEIVTMGVEGVDPHKVVGTYIKPKDWNALISDPDVVLVDTRNDYEVKIGTFKGALNPNTETFRGFPAYVKENLNPEKNKKVAMFCTGGIRCEKSTAYLKEQGFAEVYHLEGGILQYLEDVPETETMWEGECFVFDNRVTVNHALEQGLYDQCHACRLPITEEDKQHEHYEKGVSCPACYGKKDAAQIERYKERERQIELARVRGEEHIGSEVKEVMGSRRAEKQAQREQDRRNAKSAKG